ASDKGAQAERRRWGRAGARGGSAARRARRWFLPPAGPRSRPVRAGQAGRGGTTRARARAGGQARVERRPVRAVSHGARGDRPLRARTEPLPGRRGVPAEGGSRRAPRPPLRGGRRRRRSDALVDGLSQAVLDPGDEIVCGWPSFPSYVIDAKKLGVSPTTVLLRDHRYDLEAMLEAITPRTKLVYVCHPNNPTGTMNTRSELDAYF